MLSLYDKDNRYTQAATEAECAVNVALRPVWDKLIAEGYDPRQISHLFQGCVWEMELTTILDTNWKEEDKKKV